MGVRARRLHGRSNVLPGLRGIGEHHNTQTGRKPRGRNNMTSRRNVRRIAGAIAALSLIAAACGDDDDDDAAHNRGRTLRRRPRHRRPRRQRPPPRHRRQPPRRPTRHRASTARGLTAAECDTPDPVKLQLQWFVQRSSPATTRRRPGLLRGHVHRPRDPGGRRRDRAADAAGQRRRRLRDRVGAQGARQPRGRRQHRRHRPDLPALGHAAGVVQGQGHHDARPTSPARRSATGASATSTRSSPPSGRPVSTPPPTSRSSPRTSTWSACSTAASTPPRR